MKKLRKFNLKKCEMQADEMKALLGGKAIYNCFRINSNYDGGYVFYYFSTDSLSLANSWCAFWESAVWRVGIKVSDDGSYEPGEYKYHYL